MMAIREMGSVVRAFAWVEAPGALRASHTQNVPVVPANAALAIQHDFSLARRFHAWRGKSGQRYVCTVFADAALAAGFAEAIVLAVSHNVGQDKQLIAAFDTGLVGDLTAFEHFVSSANADGANEWHVHLLASDGQARGKMLNDVMRQVG